VALAHGYAKVTEEPMAVALHSNVGLMHATMALFNAFCDRVPMVVLGATGPVDAAHRRPWIDWIHTAADQGALIRNYVKWDDQPASVPAALEALARADVLTRTYPHAPVYVCLDAELQESELTEPVALPDMTRHRAPSPSPPAPADVDRATEMLQGAQRPLVLVGRVGRGEAEWAARVALAERLGAAVLCDLKAPAGFPSSHPLHATAPGTFLTAGGREVIRGADAILALDWIDLGGTLRAADGDYEPAAQVIACSADFVLHNGWSKDHFAAVPSDVALAAHPDLLVAALLERLGPGAPPARPDWPPATAAPDPSAPDDEAITMRGLAAELNAALAGHETCLVRLPLSWDGADLRVEHPLDYLGQDGGAGLASGPGMAVGAALALAGSGRLPVAVLGDGDFLMGASALWTAAHYRLPVLVVVANNRSFFNDEVHQERVEDLEATLGQAIDAARTGRPVLVDAHVTADTGSGAPVERESRARPR
jgi:thiamine pyrophosphate-dependent acetolactate synthase large subunit-like protein